MMVPAPSTSVSTPLRSVSEPSVEQLQQRIRVALSILGHLPNPSHTTERLIGVLRGDVTL